MASAVDLDDGQITFSFVDITNLRSPAAGHVDGLDVHFLGPDHVTPGAAAPATLGSRQN
jgi:hypothetical protein